MSYPIKVSDFGGSGFNIPLQAPMVGIETLRSTLGVNEDRVVALIEDGSLRWAFNIATSGMGRRLIRVWAWSVYAFLNPKSGAQPDKVAGVAALLLPTESKVSGVVSATELTKLFNVASQHVIDLIHAGFLSHAPETTWRRGPGGSPGILRSSIIKFLEDRVIQ